MKKILLLLLILVVIPILSIEINNNYTLPPCLIFNELPKEYPEEIDKLFNIYKELCVELYSNVNDSFLDTKELHKSLRDIVTELNIDQIKEIIYLEWLARMHIPNYFFEYIGINQFVSYSMNNFEELMFYANEIRDLTYIPDLMIERSLNNKGGSLPWINDFRRTIYERYNSEVDNSNFLLTYNNSRYIHYVIGTVVGEKFISNSQEDDEIEGFYKLEIKTSEKQLSIFQPIFQLLNNKINIDIGTTYLFGVYLSNLSDQLQLSNLSGREIGMTDLSISPNLVFQIDQDYILANKCISPYKQVSPYYQKYLNVDKEISMIEFIANHNRNNQVYSKTKISDFIYRFDKTAGDILGSFQLK